MSEAKCQISQSSQKKKKKEKKSLLFLKKVILSRFICEECFPPSCGATDGSFLVLEHIDNNTCKSSFVERMVFPLVSILLIYHYEVGLEEESFQEFKILSRE